MLLSGSGERVPADGCMPYTRAVLLETLRKANIMPTAIPHSTSKEIKVDGKVAILISLKPFEMHLHLTR